MLCRNIQLFVRSIEYTDIYMCVVDAHLPEGVRLLSVYLSTDEYKDAVQVCQSFDVSRQFDSATAVQPTHPVQDNASQRDDNVNSALHHEGSNIGNFDDQLISTKELHIVTVYICFV